MNRCCTAGFLLATALFLSVTHLAAQGKQIRLRNETIQTARPTPGTLAAQPALVSPGNGRLLLIQFSGPVESQWRQQLQQLGVDLLRYVPEDAYVVSLANPSAAAQVRQLPFVQWTGPYQARYKLHLSLQAGPGTAAPTNVDVAVLMAPRAAATDSAAVRTLMSSVHQEARLRLGTVLRGSISSTQLDSLAQSDAVLWVEPAPRMRLFDEVASKIVGGDDGNRSTRTLTQQAGYDGSGVVVAVADSGLDTGDPGSMHPDLAGRVDAFFQYGRLTDAADEHSHGTHVAGIIAGNAATGETDENGAWYGLGVAPGAHIVAQRMFDGIGNFEAPPSFETLTRDALSAGAVIGNNSWGDDTQGRYDISAAEFDELVRDADALTPGDQPYILEFSAGNAGPASGTIGSPAVAKNVIATGASQNNRDNLFIYAEGQEAMADFSSRGPCEDGRIKPDVVAPGTWIASLRSKLGDDQNAWAEISPNYMYQGGTSQAGPHVAGAAAVFVQYYRETLGDTPSPALVKAALINSALDLEDDFGTDPTPNPDEGWGRVDLTQIIGSDRDCVFIDQTNLLTTGASYETTVLIEDAFEPLNITLTYTDEPGFPGAIPALVNDLDLEVTGPDGTLYRGNRFEQGESIPNASTPDSINNVEGVYLSFPGPGEYRVRVHARNVAEDARADTPAADQDFALVISGKFLPPGRSVIYLDRGVYRAPDRISVGVLDRDQADQASITVTLTSGAEPSGEVLTLFRKSSVGVFTNSIQTSTGAAAADGQLQIAHGDGIAARYQDVSSGAVRLASARADLLPPVISAVTTTNRFGRTIVNWNTDEPSDSRVELGTSTALGQSTSQSQLVLNHSVSLDNLVAGATYHFRVASTDEAGNSSTNDNGGALFSFVAPAAPPVLLVDGFYDDLFYDPPPPLTSYTGPLNQLGVSFDVWDRETAGPLSAADLRPYRVVIWRVPELNFTTYPTWTAGERQAITNYLNEGGSLFVASMELLSRLSESSADAFRAEALHVADFNFDTTVASVTGTSGDLIGNGMSFNIDYSDYGDFDISDTLIPATDAAGIFVDDETEQFAGLRYPRTGADSAGRVVFLAFPFEGVPANGAAPNNRTELLRRILQFLAPGLNGDAVITLDRPAYTLPSQIIVELGDADLSGTGQATVTASTTTEPAGQSLVLQETTRRGVFRGTITLADATNAPAAGRLRAMPGDQITFRYNDQSRSTIIEQSAVVDVQSPQITDVGSEPDYSTAIIYWSTDEPADALVQFGESLPLPVNRTKFDPVLTYDHELSIAGLQPDRTYYFRVVSRDAAGNAVTDDNGGQFYSLHTRKPLSLPVLDAFETGATNWSVFSSDESETQWTLGVPRNGVETTAHSPTNAWGSSIQGLPEGLIDTFLISPAVQLSGGNQVTLKFWHSYDFSELSEFDIIQGGELLLIENDTEKSYPLATYFDSNGGWEQEEIDLTPYLGKVVYLVWHHQLFSLDNFRRPGWLIDDVEIVSDTIPTGTVSVTNNLSQATVAITGPASRTGAGRSLVITNAPPGQYVAAFGMVPYYTTPPPQTNTLTEGGTVSFSGTYSFQDSNGNGISDSWEQDRLGAVSPNWTTGQDSDLDGLSDYAEFIAGTNPTNSASSLTANLEVQPNSGFRFVWPTVAGRSYRLLGSTDLLNWTPVTAWTRAAGASLSYLLTPTDSAVMYRVEVQP